MPSGSGWRTFPPELYVSEALYEELKEDPEIRLLGGLLPMEFDGQGNLKPGHYGKGDR